MADRRIVIFLSHGDPTALRLAGSAALAAAAADDRVDVFLFGSAVAPVVAAHEDPEEHGALLHQARQVGACRLVACSASVVEGKVSLEDANRALDAIVGWPTILEWSAGVADRFFF